METRLIQCSAAVLLPLLLSMQGSPAEAQEPQVGAYRIGALFALTGPAATLGEPERDTARMLEEQINAQGGIDGRPLQILIRDTRAEEERALMAARDLIENEKVLALVGPTRSSTTMAVLDYAQNAETPLVSCAAYPGITAPVRSCVFRTAPEDRLAVQRICRHLQTQGISRIAALTVANAFGASGLWQIEQQAPQAGVNLVAEEQLADADVDFTPQLARIAATDAKALICWGVGRAPAMVTRQVKKLGINIPLIQSHACANRGFIEGAGEAGSGVVLPAGKLMVADQLPDDDPQKAALLTYAQHFRARYARDPDWFGGLAWDAVKLVVAALRAAGPDRARIRDEIENTSDFAGITGIFNYSPEDHAGLTADCFVMVQIQDGQWHLIKE